MKRLFLIFVCLLLLTSSVLLVASAAGTLYISKQPMDHFVEIGETATFEVVAVGEGLTYQWQFAMSGSDNWSNVWNGESSVYNYPNVQQRNDGMKFRCVITDGSGNTVISRVSHIFVGTNALSLYASQGLSFVLEWVSSLCGALVSPDGALFPLIGVLAIGIGVSVLLLGIKAIRSFSWGL